MICRWGPPAPLWKMIMLTNQALQNKNKNKNRPQYSFRATRSKAYRWTVRLAYSDFHFGSITAFSITSHIVDVDEWWAIAHMETVTKTSQLLLSGPGWMTWDGLEVTVFLFFVFKSKFLHGAGVSNIRSYYSHFENHTKPENHEVCNGTCFLPFLPSNPGYHTFSSFDFFLSG